jgi:tRNA threonylcarbamoyladenosine biosynthesis protein TsaB
VKILALESSSDAGSVALWCDGAWQVRAADTGRTQSELMLPWVDAVLAEAGIGVRALDAIAFGAGPGSFTGVRLACGVAQGLALAVDLPVFAICTLEAMALMAGREKVYVCVDARMHEVYCAAYARAGDGVETTVEPVVCPPAEVPLPPGAGWFGCGDGFACQDGIAAARLAAAVHEFDAAARPQAEGVARLAALRYARGERPDAATATPLYVRDKVALTTAERRARGGRA